MIGVSEVFRIISEGTIEGRGHMMEGIRRMRISIVRAARLPMEPRGREVGISMSASRAISNVL